MLRAGSGREAAGALGGDRQSFIHEKALVHHLHTCTDQRSLEVVRSVGRATSRPNIQARCLGRQPEARNLAVSFCTQRPPLSQKSIRRVL